MAVVGHLPRDARVWREVDSLANTGYRVRLIGMRYGINADVTTAEGGLSVTEIPLGRQGEARPLLRARALVRLWWQVMRTPAAVYHCHNIHPGLAMLLAARVRRARLVYDAHELYGEVQGTDAIGSRLAARVAGWLERLLVRTADGVITTNVSRARVLEQRHMRADVVVLRNVPRLVADVRLTGRGGDPSRKRLLYQGGIYARTRAFEMTIRALTELPEFEFTIVGFGRDADRELIARWARENGVADRVRIQDALPFDELVSNAASATVGLVPLRAISANSYLGDTNKMFEYLMAGLPVAGSDFPELRRVLCEGSPPVGELFDPESSESIAAAIRRVADDDHDARRREARRLALKVHNWETEEPRLLELYSSLYPPG